MARWGEQDIPDLTGRRAIVTGANSGLGYEVVRALATRGAQVVLAVRDAAKGEAAADRVRTVAPAADLRVERLDVADLSSVRDFAGRQVGSDLDLLVNNAGVMAIPRRLTPDGFETQLGGNHLGHFALTGLLLPALLRRPGARVVAVSSGLAARGRIDVDDPQGERAYDPWAAYGQSKLANLMGALELDRRLRATGAAVLSVAAHPGYAATNLQSVAPRETGERLRGAMMRVANVVVAQSAAAGALPLLYAATAPDVPGGGFVGPVGLGGLRGRPGLVEAYAPARDTAVAARLWTLSEELTGVRYP